MNSRKYDTLDGWFYEAFEVYAQAQPSTDVWSQIVSELKSPLPSWWRHFFLRVSGPIRFHWPISQQAVRGKDGKFTPSPFLSVMIKQVLDMRMAF